MRRLAVDFAVVRSSIERASDARSSRLDELARKVSEGLYHVPAEAVAESMLEQARSAA